MAVRPAPRQLALSLGYVESFAREDFLEGPSNAAALALIAQWPDWPTRAVVLVGPPGSGKSHLAAIWAAHSGARFIAARALEPSSLPRALATGALVVEDLAAGRIHEPALFHLLNLVEEEGSYLLLTAQTQPSTLPIGTADLASRLRALPTVALMAPDDALFRAVLIKLFADRQIRVDESLIAYLTTRLERSFAAARSAVDRLDRMSLRHKRPLTRALAAEVFGAGIS
jgi:chromosomal replication initiation ATPase DnaA